MTLIPPFWKESVLLLKFNVERFLSLPFLLTISGFKETRSDVSNSNSVNK